jgi:predicted nuclease of restriction endonuclease-like (RecB) superfamily
MRAFAEAWPEESFVQQVVGQIPWGHNIRILDLVKNTRHREWYVRAAVQHGWSRSVLVHQIESGLHRRQGRAQTNFTQTLPPPHSDLAQQVLKDPYNFDLLTLAGNARGRARRQFRDCRRDGLVRLAGVKLVLLDRRRAAFSTGDQ